VFSMSTMLRSLAHDEAGAILSAELIIILTITVLGMVVGLVNLQTALISEFTDLSMAFQSLNQSFCTPSFFGCRKWWSGWPTSFVAGSCFFDRFNGCVGATAVGGGYGGWGGYDIVGPATFVGQPSCPTGGCATGDCPTGNCTSAHTDTFVPPSPATDNSLQPVPDPGSANPK
jgi:Flp pilus assembly pilin Flp